MRSSAALICVLMALVFATPQSAQQAATTEKVKLGKPKIISISPAAIEFRLSAEILDIPRDGRVERVSFQQFTVNGVPFEIDDHIIPFDVKRERSARLPGELTCRIRLTDAGRKLIRDALDPKKQWQVVGTVRIKASAKRLGIRFRREMDMSVSMPVENPLPYR